MKTLIIACQTLENELNHAMGICNCDYDIKWFETGLHNVPKNLCSALQEYIDAASDYDKILLCMGLCGNAVVGLNSGAHTLVLPRVDDCISLMLGSDEARQNIPDAGLTYFMTEGWLKGELNIWGEYQRTIATYGEEEGELIFDMMLGHYKALALIDTEAYDISAVEAQMPEIAAALKLNYRKLRGSTQYLEDLLNGNWNKQRFIIVPPNTSIDGMDILDLY